MLHVLVRVKSARCCCGLYGRLRAYALVCVIAVLDSRSSFCFTFVRTFAHSTRHLSNICPAVRLSLSFFRFQFGYFLVSIRLRDADVDDDFRI